MVLEDMVNSDRQLTIRDAGQDDEFAAWLDDLVELHPSPRNHGKRSEHYLVLTDEIGDWIGGIRYWLRGGVASLVDVGIAPHERHQGHGFRLLSAFESRAAELGAHLLEFWTDDLRSEAVFLAQGWNRVAARPDYIGGTTWYLFEKRLTEPN